MRDSLSGPDTSVRRLLGVADAPKLLSSVRFFGAVAKEQADEEVEIKSTKRSDTSGSKDGSSSSRDGGVSTGVDPALLVDQMTPAELRALAVTCVEVQGICEAEEKARLGGSRR